MLSPNPFSILHPLFPFNLPTNNSILRHGWSLLPWSAVTCGLILQALWWWTPWCRQNQPWPIPRMPATWITMFLGVAPATTSITFTDLHYPKVWLGTLKLKNCIGLPQKDSVVIHRNINCNAHVKEYVTRCHMHLWLVAFFALYLRINLRCVSCHHPLWRTDCLNVVQSNPFHIHPRWPPQWIRPSGQC